jgi:hypothetical protein
VLGSDVSLPLFIVKNYGKNKSYSRSVNISAMTTCYLVMGSQFYNNERGG